jgi:chemotaxis protein CheD
MNNFESQLPFIYLKPSEIYITECPSMVETVLGSCVSVTMFDRTSGVGMICHCLLPQCKNEVPCDGDCSEGFKYVDCSIRRMLAKYTSYDVKRSNIEVKVFGGADMFNAKTATANSIAVGKQNIETALKIIKREQLNLITTDVGGTEGRKIYFNTRTGEVHLKRLNKAG